MEGQRRKETKRKERKEGRRELRRTGVRREGWRGRMSGLLIILFATYNYGH